MTKIAFRMWKPNIWICGYKCCEILRYRQNMFGWRGFRLCGVQMCEVRLQLFNSIQYLLTCKGSFSDTWVTNWMGYWFGEYFANCEKYLHDSENSIIPEIRWDGMLMMIWWSFMWYICGTHFRIAQITWNFVEHILPWNNGVVQVQTDFGNYDYRA